MNFRQAVQFIEGRRFLGMKPGLERVKELLTCFGSPQNSVPAIHVAGTNGKGSTCAYIESMLRHSGYKTGLFTSPFLLSPLEMFRIDGSEIDEDSFSGLVRKVEEFCVDLDMRGLGPTEYEIYSAMALEYFKTNGVDIAVIEAGMGGTFDCTNILSRKEAAVITKISMDHTEFLGGTLDKIASHKAGIIAPGVKVISWPQAYEAQKVVSEKAEELGCVLKIAGFHKIETISMSKHGSRFHFGDIKNLQVGIPGENQIKNAVMAVETLLSLKDAYPVTADSIQKGLEAAVWPARFELLTENPDIILDSAHNTDGATDFVNTYKSLYGNQKAIVIFGVMKDKDYEGMIRQISTIADGFILVKPENARALSLDDLKETVDKYCGKVTKSDTINEALFKSLEISKNKGVICALGSIYYAGSFREAFKQLEHINFTEGFYV